jgi:hypothetical protein
MKNYFTLFLLVAAIFVGCTTESSKVIVLTNPSDSDRQDEPVLLEKDKLSELIGEIPEGKVPVLTDAEGNNVACQTDDMDGDGSWDELFILVDVAANESKELTIAFVNPEEAPEYEIRTNIRLGDKNPPHNELDDVARLESNTTEISSQHFQMEGPAWENDVVGFRNYYDARNGIDIFGKRTKEMVLDGVGIGEHSYHELDDWGMDILKVGNSLGAGAIAMKKGDSIYRLGLTEKGTFNRVVEGPVRSVFQLNFEGWEVEGNKYNVTHEISIWGGANFYKSSVSIDGLEGVEKLVTGIVNMESDTFHVYDFNDTYLSMITHANQAYNGEILGMGLLLNKADFVEKVTMPDEGEGITQTYAAILNLSADKATNFCFYAGWELQDEKLKNLENFVELLKSDAEWMSNPIEVSVK